MIYLTTRFCCINGCGDSDFALSLLAERDEQGDAPPHDEQVLLYNTALKKRASLTVDNVPTERTPQC